MLACVCVSAAWHHTLPLAICAYCFLSLVHTGRTWRPSPCLPTQHVTWQVSACAQAHKHVFGEHLKRFHQQQILFLECAFNGLTVFQYQCCQMYDNYCISTILLTTVRYTIILSKNRLNVRSFFNKPTMKPYFWFESNQSNQLHQDQHHWCLHLIPVTHISTTDHACSSCLIACSQ